MVKVLDLATNTITHTIKAHDDDVNTICFLTRNDPNIFITGSDDRKVKLWDIRQPEIANHKPQG
jgi:WD repeat-containing protein 23